MIEKIIEEFKNLWSAGYQSKSFIESFIRTKFAKLEAENNALKEEIRKLHNDKLWSQKQF